MWLIKHGDEVLFASTTEPQMNEDGTGEIDIGRIAVAPGWTVEFDDNYIPPNPPQQPDTTKEVLLQKILSLQQKCLRCLVEDAPDTTFLDKYKTQISVLRDQLKTV